MIEYLFILFATIAVISALIMITNKHAVNSALFLVINMVALAGIYLLLENQFLAVIQVLVYAGAIMVLFLFVIMLLNQEAEDNLLTKISLKYVISVLLGMVVLSQLIYAIAGWADALPQVVSPATAELNTVENIAEVLFTNYLLPFEVTGILLTAAVVGALIIAQRTIKIKK